MAIILTRRTVRVLQISFNVRNQIVVFLTRGDVMVLKIVLMVLMKWDAVSLHDIIFEFLLNLHVFSVRQPDVIYDWSILTNIRRYL